MQSIIIIIISKWILGHFLTREQTFARSIRARFRLEGMPSFAAPTTALTFLPYQLMD